MCIIESVSCTLQVIDHYENPRNVGSMDKNDKNVGTGLVGAPACGDVMKLQVSLISNIFLILPYVKLDTASCNSTALYLSSLQLHIYPNSMDLVKSFFNFSLSFNTGNCENIRNIVKLIQFIKYIKFYLLIIVDL